MSDPNAPPPPLSAHSEGSSRRTGRRARPPSTRAAESTPNPNDDHSQAQGRRPAHRATVNHHSDHIAASAVTAAAAAAAAGTAGTAAAALSSSSSPAAPGRTRPPTHPQQNRAPAHPPQARQTRHFAAGHTVAGSAAAVQSVGDEPSHPAPNPTRRRRTRHRAPPQTVVEQPSSGIAATTLPEHSQRHRRHAPPPHQHASFHHPLESSSSSQTTSFVANPTTPTGANVSDALSAGLQSERNSRAMSHPMGNQPLFQEAAAPHTHRQNSSFPTRAAAAAAAVEHGTSQANLFSSKSYAGYSFSNTHLHNHHLFPAAAAAPPRFMHPPQHPIWYSAATGALPSSSGSAASSSIGGQTQQLTFSYSFATRETQLPALLFQQSKAVFPVDVLYTTSEQAANEYIQEHFATTSLIGLDLEWHPEFQAKQFNGVSLIQLATETKCLLYHQPRVESLPSELAKLLANRAVLKVGIGISNDLARLRRACINSGHVHLESIFDLGALSLLVFSDLRGAPGLRSLATRCGLAINKAKQVSMSAWDRIPLNHTQLVYAVQDAWASFFLFACLYALSRDIPATRVFETTPKGAVLAGLDPNSTIFANARAIIRLRHQSLQALGFSFTVQLPDAQISVKSFEKVLDVSLFAKHSVVATADGSAEGVSLFRSSSSGPPPR